LSAQGAVPEEVLSGGGCNHMSQHQDVAVDLRCAFNRITVAKSESILSERQMSRTEGFVPQVSLAPANARVTGYIV